MRHVDAETVEVMWKELDTVLVPLKCLTKDTYLHHMVTRDPLGDTSRSQSTQATRPQALAARAVGTSSAPPARAGRRPLASPRRSVYEIGQRDRSWTSNTVGAPFAHLMTMHKKISTSGIILDALERLSEDDAARRKESSAVGSVDDLGQEPTLVYRLPYTLQQRRGSWPSVIPPRAY